MRTFTRFLLTAALAGGALGQEFEVVSIKPNRSGDSGSDSDREQGRLTIGNLSLKRLVAMAYRLKEHQVEGPDWMDTERFDVVAKIPAGLPAESEQNAAVIAVMMQKMLAERFSLTVHTDVRSMTAYALTAGKKGVKFSEAPGCESHSSNGKSNHYEGTCISMSVFSDFLTRRKADLPTDLPVIDMTGMKGFYNVRLDWVKDTKQPSDEPKPGPLLADAVEEQLGLKLEMRKLPVQILVVDRASKVPTEN